MRILYLHQYFNTPSMSGGTRSYEMAKRLVKAGHEVHMITTRRDRSGVGWDVTTVDGIQVHWHNTTYSNYFGFLRRVVAFIRFALVAAHRATHLGGDIVFATSTPLTIAIPAIWAARRLDVPMVFEVRDLWPELPIAIGELKNPALRWLAMRLEESAYRNASHVIALSPGMADGVAKTGYPRQKITVIPNNCNIERFQGHIANIEETLDSHPYLRDKRIILYAGTLGVINGVGYLVDIAAELRALDPSVTFLVIGDGKEKPAIEERARNVGVLGNNFWILPRVTKEEIPVFFALATMGCSLFIDLPEMWSNSANKFFDTLASGRPIMINYRGWQANELEESGAGIVIPPRQPAVAAEALLRFLNDDLMRRKACEAALRLALTRFNTENLFEDFRLVLEDARANFSS